MSIDQILSTLVVKVTEHFRLDPQDALAVVAQSKTADELATRGNVGNLSIDRICKKLYDEISNPK